MLSKEQTKVTSVCKNSKAFNLYFLISYRPVLITDALKGWKANSWNKDFFVKHYGDQQVVMKAVQVYDYLHKCLTLVCF